jgi:hypothetical protein
MPFLLSRFEAMSCGLLHTPTAILLFSHGMLRRFKPCVKSIENELNRVEENKQNECLGGFDPAASWPIGYPAA